MATGSPKFEDQSVLKQNVYYKFKKGIKTFHMVNGLPLIQEVSCDKQESGQRQTNDQTRSHQEEELKTTIAKAIKKGSSGADQPIKDYHEKESNHIQTSTLSFHVSATIDSKDDSPNSYKTNHKGRKAKETESIDQLDWLSYEDSNQVGPCDKKITVQDNDNVNQTTLSQNHHYGQGIGVARCINSKIFTFTVLKTSLSH